MLATGCEDKCVRVFYVAASSDLPLKVFSGESRTVRREVCTCVGHVPFVPSDHVLSSRPHGESLPREMESFAGRNFM